MLTNLICLSFSAAMTYTAARAPLAQTIELLSIVSVRRRVRIGDHEERSLLRITDVRVTHIVGRDAV